MALMFKTTLGLLNALYHIFFKLPAVAIRARSLRLWIRFHDYLNIRNRRQYNTEPHPPFCLCAIRQRSTQPRIKRHKSTDYAIILLPDHIRCYFHLNAIILTLTHEIITYFPGLKGKPPIKFDWLDTFVEVPAMYLFFTVIGPIVIYCTTGRLLEPLYLDHPIKAIQQYLLSFLRYDGRQNISRAHLYKRICGHMLFPFSDTHKIEYWSPMRSASKTAHKIYYDRAFSITNDKNIFDRGFITWIHLFCAPLWFSYLATIIMLLTHNASGRMLILPIIGWSITTGIYIMKAVPNLLRYMSFNRFDSDYIPYYGTIAHYNDSLREGQRRPRWAKTLERSWSKSAISLGASIGVALYLAAAQVVCSQ